MKKRTVKKAVKKVHKKIIKKAPATGVLPLGDRVLVKPFSANEAGSLRPSGIIIPETVDKERPEQGKVIAVGSGRYEDGKRMPMSVSVGDTVLFSKYGYDEIKWQGQEYFILKEESILAVIK